MQNITNLSYGATASVLGLNTYEMIAYRIMGRIIFMTYDCGFGLQTPIGTTTENISFAMMA